MPTFPSLKTGAVAQYPLKVLEAFRTEEIGFLDGSSHRYSTGGTPLRNWFVSFERLDPRETDVVLGFLAKHGAEVFSFVDPLTGATIPSCTVRGFEFINTTTDELNDEVSVVIEELP